MTVCMIVKNSGDIVKNTLEFLADNFEKVKIVYDYSIDNTVEILMEYKDKFQLIQRDFDHFGNQWNFCLSNTDTEWNLKIDADEIYNNPTDFDKLCILGEKTNIEGFYFKRYNLQKDIEHYKKEGFPDPQVRLIRKNIRTSGDPANDAFVTSGKLMHYDKISIIHYAHIRNAEAQKQKGKDRLPVADYDPLDGPRLKENINWFLDRNKLWDNNIEKNPIEIQEIINKYKKFL